MWPNVNWRNREFLTPQEIMTEAQRYRRDINYQDVIESVGYQPAYDGRDLLDLLKYAGYRPRLPGESAQRLLELVAQFRDEFTALPTIEDMAFDLEDSIDTFLLRLLPPVSEQERFEANEILRTKLKGRADRGAAINVVLRALCRRFPDLPLRARTDDLPEAFSRIQQARRACDDVYHKHNQFWERCLEIARQVVNPGRRGTRRLRHLYIAESIFDHLCHGAPLSKGDLEGTNRNYVAWLRLVQESKEKKLRRALRAAAAEMSTPRVLEDIIRDAYRRLRDSGNYDNFRRRVYRHFEEHKPFKKWLITADESVLKLGSKSSNRPSVAR